MQTLPLRQGSGSHSSLQTSPASSFEASGGTQAQVKVPIPSMQAPPLRHGLSQQL
eukprot:COSAG06_NODE_46528_length_346_cov_0.781377_1_plen_54_part_10